MKAFISHACLALGVLFLSAFPSFGDDALVRGEDLIKVPAKSDGLYLHNLFQSNMVIQRDKPIRVWGWSDPQDAVAVSFAGQSAHAKPDKGGRWQVTFAAVPANHTPQQMVVKGKVKTITLDNILLGDVWVLGGQSNMEFNIAKVENGALEMVSANFPEIRLMTVPQLADGTARENFPTIYQWSDWSKEHFRRGLWEVCSAETVREMSAIGYVFGRRLHMASGVPIGLLDISIGGTTLEAWTPLETARKVEDPEVKEMLADWDSQVATFDPKQDLQERIAKFEARVAGFVAQGKEVPAHWKKPDDLQQGPVANRNRPGNCYQGLVEPLIGLQVKGAIFHQGYNNCFSGSKGARVYGKLFPAMIQGWRDAFSDPELPFGVISLCTSGTAQTAENFCELMVDVGAEIREAQYQAFRSMRDAGDQKVGFVSSYDLRRRWYHPQLKVPAGERIARWALATEYGFEKQLSWEPPVIEKVEPVDGALHLTFNTDVSNVDDGSEMQGFAISGEDRAYQMAEVNHLVTGKDNRGRPQTDRKVVVLTSPLVEKPVHFRYAWARNPMGNIQLPGNSDVPLATQRSDHWEVHQVPVDGGEVHDRAAIGAVRKAMKQADLKRRLYQAQELIKANGS